MNPKDIEKMLMHTDCCMMTTIDGKGQINSRPMLQNKETEYNGFLYFFSMKDTRKVRDLAVNPNISLTYQDKGNILFGQVYGQGEIVSTPEDMAPHWDKKLDLWWPQREHTPGMCMIRVRVSWIRYWYQGKDCVIEKLRS